MHLPKKRVQEKQVLSKLYFDQIGKYIKSIQLESGAIPSNDDGSHDPWDHIESIMGLNFANEYESSKLAFEWLVNNQNKDGSWFSKYIDEIPIEKNNLSKKIHCRYLLNLFKNSLGFVNNSLILFKSFI